MIQNSMKINKILNNVMFYILLKIYVLLQDVSAVLCSKNQQTQSHIQLHLILGKHIFFYQDVKMETFLFQFWLTLQIPRRKQ